MNMEARRAELEKKRQKLELLRQERQKVKEAKERLQAAAQERGDASVDEILQSLEKTGIDLQISDAPLGVGGPHVIGDTPDAHSLASSVQATPTRKARKSVALQLVTVNQSNILPKECVTYSKTTQTMGGGDREDRFGGFGGKGRKDSQAFDYYKITVWEEEWDDEFQAIYGDEDGDEGPPPSLEAMHQKAQQMAAQHTGHQAVQGPASRTLDELDELIKKKDDEIKKAIRMLNVEERQQIFLSPEFRIFMDRSSRIMERALTEDVDIFTDYTGAGEETEA